MTIADFPSLDVIPSERQQSGTMTTKVDQDFPPVSNFDPKIASSL